MRIREEALNLDLPEQCKTILRNMRAKGQDVPDESQVDNWTWEEKLHFHANYAPYYL